MSARGARQTESQHFTLTRARSRRSAESKIEGLRKHYGFIDPKHDEYFCPRRSRSGTFRSGAHDVGRFLTDKNRETVSVAIERVLGALWEMLSASAGGTQLPVEWRRGWDSNPRGLSPCRFSRPEPSTTRPPLQLRACLFCHLDWPSKYPAVIDSTAGQSDMFTRTMS